jgi:hypothetical protein
MVGAQILLHISVGSIIPKAPHLQILKRLLPLKVEADSSKFINYLVTKHYK